MGVDALTHGLATLTNSTKRGNDHARWVKKFSLGNGPAEWVSEYNISKEGGKMLGTLVNLAITRMENLEAFSWDMPTGILRDVFMSLHDLTESLKSLHVRFHDNRETTPPTSQDPSRRVESPTFKGFKGLRTLSVLDVDERQYLEEMSYAIEDSVGKLKELRLGIAEHHPRWIRDFDDPENQSSSGESQEGAFGGVLGVLFSRIINQEEGRRKRRGARADDLSIVGTSLANAAVETAEAVSMTSGPPSAVYVNPTDPANTTPAPDGSIPSTEQSLEHAPGLVPEEVPAISSASSGIVVIEGAPSLGGSFVDVSAPVPTPTPTTLTVTAPIVTPVTPAVLTRSFQRPYGPEMESKQLKLETLALERVPLSIPIMVHTNAIDWSCLSNLTILNCANHERLWKALRRKFSPHPAPTPSSILSTGINLKQGAQGNSPYRAKAPSHQSSTRDYKIRLKKIHTDGVTHTLIGFIKETLPPNSLEILFLQETMADTTVTMDTIYRGAIRPHKGSLKKLLINSKNHDETEGRFWTFGQEHLRFISGKMPKLRELGMALDHKDWVSFLSLIFIARPKADKRSTTS